MIWPATIIGGTFGFILASIPGAVFGLVLGAMLDRYLAISSWSILWARLRGQKPARYSVEHTQFMLLGYLAKINGRVLPVHIQQARIEMRRLGLAGYQYKAAITAFSQGKDIQLKELRPALQACFRGEVASEQLLSSAWRLVWAEHKVSDLQRKTLEYCGKWLGIGRARLRELEVQAKPARSSKPAVTQTEVGAALQVLGLAQGRYSFSQIQRAYRSLLSQHHPDKLIGAGASAAQVEQGNQKTRQLHKAYALLRKHYRKT